MRYEAMTILHDRIKKQAEDVNDVLQRMEEGSYGLRDDCGKPIQLERLDAQPTSFMCIECQQINEGA